MYMREEPISPSHPQHLHYSTSRSQIVGTIRSPLGFFALALLIVEAFLLGAGVFFQISPELRVVMIIVGIFLFLLVFGVVCWLVVRHPTNLVFSESSHVEYEAMRIFGSNTNPITGNALKVIPAVNAPPLEPNKQLPAVTEED
jgi:hypothetical protein